MKNFNFLKLFFIFTGISCANAQDLSTREVEGAILRKYSTLNSELEQPAISTNQNDFFPQWGFLPRNPVYVSSMLLQEKSSKEIRICFNVSTTTLQISHVEKIFSKQGFVKAGGQNCTNSAIGVDGVNLYSSYYKDIDLSRIVLASSLPPYITTNVPLYSKKASITIPRETNIAEITLSTNLVKDTKTCAQGYSGTNTKIQTLFNTICQGLTPAEQSSTAVTYGTQFKLNANENSAPLILNDCTLEFDNSCVLQFSLPNNVYFKRNRFYGQRLIWNEYVYARTTDTSLTDFVSKQYGLIGINVK